MRTRVATGLIPYHRAESIGIFKGRERKAKEAKMEAAEQKASDLKDRISRMVQEQGYRHLWPSTIRLSA